VVGLPLALLVILFTWRAFRDNNVDKRIDVLVREHQNDSERIWERFENELIRDRERFENERLRDRINQERMEDQLRRILERETSQPSQDA